MHEAGFEPANPKDVGLSDAALTTNRFALTQHFINIFFGCIKLNHILQKKTKSYIYIILHLLILKMIKISE